jgi:hypothetical protein
LPEEPENTTTYHRNEGIYDIISSEIQVIKETAKHIIQLFSASSRFSIPCIL